MAQRSGKVVFVGNIPYDSTEEQLIEVFSKVGPVVNFRIVTDRETGKPKGFGFCEYKDVDTAKSAIRNLNKFDFKGRQLHVDSSDKAGGDVGGGASKPAPSQPLLPTQPTGQMASGGIDFVTHAIEGFSIAQLYEMTVRAMAGQNYQSMRDLLANNPQLSLALLCSESNVQQQAAQSQTAPPPPSSAPAAQIQHLTPEQRAQLKALMNLTPEQIAALPPEERMKVDALRQQVRDNRIQL